MVLRSKLHNLCWKKVDTFDDVMLGKRADAPDKSLQVWEKPFSIRPDCLGSRVPRPFYTFVVLDSQEFLKEVSGDPTNVQLGGDPLTQDALTCPGCSADYVDHGNSLEGRANKSLAALMEQRAGEIGQAHTLAPVFVEVGRLEPLKKCRL